MQRVISLMLCLKSLNPFGKHLKFLSPKCDLNKDVFALRCFSLKVLQKFSACSEEKQQFTYGSDSFQVGDPYLTLVEKDLPKGGCDHLIGHRPEDRGVSSPTVRNNSCQLA